MRARKKKFKTEVDIFTKSLASRSWGFKKKHQIRKYHNKIMRVDNTAVLALVNLQSKALILKILEQVHNFASV